MVAIYATSAAEPWLTELYECADGLTVLLMVTAQSPDIFIRVGEPERLVSPAYQIDEEELLIVTNRDSPLQKLSLEEAQALFMGEGDPSLQVWVYVSGEDLQIVFDQLVMKGRGVTSLARLAASTQQMSDALNAETNSVGILPRHWKMEKSREIFSAGYVPVLAITRAQPQGAIKDLLVCLQNN